MRRIDIAAAALLGAAPVTTWWVLGDLSEDVPPESANHVVRLPEVPPGVEAGIGLGATVVGVLGLAVLLVATVRGDVGLRRWGVWVPFVGLGAYAGFTARVLTAGVVGANIGAGMLMLATPVVVAAAFAIARANRDAGEGGR